MATDDLITYVEQLGAGPWALLLMLFLFTFVLEDPATLAAAYFSSQNVVSPVAGFLAVYLGIILGDLALYFLGRYSYKISWLQKFSEKSSVKKVSEKIEGRVIEVVLLSRFIPGARLPTYFAFGLFRVPFRLFCFGVLVAVTIWSNILFWCSYYFGVVLESYQALLAILGLYLLLIVFRVLVQNRTTSAD